MVDNFANKINYCVHISYKGNYPLATAKGIFKIPSAIPSFIVKQDFI